jgi:hypothetical protein
MRALFAASLFALALFFQFSFAQASEPAQKEWTMLVFLNGNNNLDQFGSLNLNQAETVGSTADINVVVQWASLKNKDVRRLLVTKDNDRRKVTSPVVENMGKVDMGDYRNLVEFIKWGVKNFPAKRYFLDIWNHGSGWHDKLRRRSGFGFDDISSDDLSGNSITTEQLGMALRQASAEIGQKIDLYGNDACLMAMAEVAAEVAGGVKVFLGSQDLEPGEGWHYGDFLTLFAAKPAASAQEVSQMLVSSYVASYSGGSNGRQNVTLSSFDLEQQERLQKAVKAFGAAIQKVDRSERRKILQAIQKSQNYFYEDYVDLLDLVGLLERGQISTMDVTQLALVKDATKAFVVANGQNGFPKATGISIWAPADKETYNKYANHYSKLRFEADTEWSKAIKYLLE